MRYKVAVVAFPWKSYAPYKFLSDVLLILEPICERITLIDGNTKNIKTNNKNVNLIDIGLSMHYIGDKKPRIFSLLLWIIKFLYVQIIESIIIINKRKQFDIIIFYMAYPHYLLPLLVSKLLRKKTFEIATRSGKSHSQLIRFLDKLYYYLLDGISPESDYLIETLVPYHYRNKILPEGTRFIDISKYKIMKSYNERGNVVGFIGRLTKEKGVDELIKSIIFLETKNIDAEFIIGGSGNLSEWLENEACKINESCRIKVQVKGFVEEEMLPSYLNECKLLVLPTKHDEGLPTIILEAMACGTPVLSSPAGAIPSVVQDGMTGFILKKTDPESIADSIFKALNYSDIGLISQNANKMVTVKYNYQDAVGRWEEMLSRVAKR